MGRITPKILHMAYRVKLSPNRLEFLGVTADVAEYCCLGNDSTGTDALA